MADYTAPAAERSAAVTELWAAVRDAARPGRRAGFPRGLAVGLALAILAAAASAALMGLAGWLIVRSAQTGLSATSTFSWIYPAAGVEALAVVRTAARYGERLTTHGATLQILARLRARVFASATQMTPRRLHQFHSGDLLDRVQADIDSLDRVVLAVAVPAVVAAIIGASGLAVLALIRPAFAVVTGLALAVALTGDLVVGGRGRRAGGELARARAAARARLVEVLEGRMEIAACGVGPRALAELGSASAPPTRRANAGPPAKGPASSAPIWPPPAPWLRCWPTAPAGRPPAVPRGTGLCRSADDDNVRGGRVARRGRSRGGPGPHRVAAAQRDDRAGRPPSAR